MRARHIRSAALFLLPYTIGAIVFILGPIVYSLSVSFTDRGLFGPGHGVGWSNYSKAFADPLFVTSLTNTAYYALLVVPAEVVLSILLAVLLNQNLRGTTVFRSIFFMPFVISLVSVGLIWGWMYSPSFGSLDQMLHAVNLSSPGWLSDPNMGMPSVALATLWRNTGYYAVIFLAALQSVPQELYEAARIEGAGGVRVFLRITLPLLTPTIFFVLVIATIFASQVFDLTFIMTQGGPIHSTLTTGLYIYQTAFSNGQLGYASAQSWVLLIVVLALTGVYFLSERWWVFYG